MCIGIHEINIVNNVDQLCERALDLRKTFPKLFAESFVFGREFTVFVIGDARDGLATLTPVESRPPIFYLLSDGASFFLFCLCFKITPCFLLVDACVLCATYPLHVLAR